MIFREPHSHCHYCGKEYDRSYFGQTEFYCVHCHNYAFLNPAPVAVLLIPFEDGIFALRRGIEPRKGYVALPGGYIKKGEDWRVGGAREALEEVQVTIPNPERNIQYFGVSSTPSGSEILIFGRVRPDARIVVDPFEPSEEATERIILRIGYTDELAFSLNDEMIQKYFSM